MARKCNLSERARASKDYLGVRKKPCLKRRLGLLRELWENNFRRIAFSPLIPTLAEKKFAFFMLLAVFS
jgi:hypothetical protein